jgi:hypothetical protein
LWLAETSQQPISQTTWLKVTPNCNHCNHYLWLAETSQQPISQTTWLKVTPHCNHCNHCCMGMIMDLCLAFYVFFCKPVDVVEGISLRACCFDEGVCKVGVGGG